MVEEGGGGEVAEVVERGLKVVVGCVVGGGDIEDEDDDVDDVGDWRGVQGI